MLATFLLLACLDEATRQPPGWTENGERTAAVAPPGSAPVGTTADELPTVDGEPIPLCINEFVPDTRVSAHDEHGVASDWIELHNPTTLDVPLAGWSITDDPEGNPHKHWLDDELVVEAGGFLVLWADHDPAAGPTHLDFALSDEGEAVGLFGPGESGSIVWFGPVANDLAVRRVTDCCPDGEEGCFGYVFAGTPGTTNAP